MIMMEAGIFDSFDRIEAEVVPVILQHIFVELVGLNDNEIMFHLYHFYPVFIELTTVFANHIKPVRFFPYVHSTLMKTSKFTSYRYEVLLTYKSTF